MTSSGVLFQNKLLFITKKIGDFSQKLYGISTKDNLDIRVPG